MEISILHFLYMSTNLGKDFEKRFTIDWKETMPDSLCYRLYDITMGYKGVANAADFICYSYPKCYMIDCKTTEGNTIGFSDIRQYDLMLNYKDIPGLHVGIIWWCRKQYKVVWIPIQTLEELKQDDKKSYNIKYLDTKEYYALEIPSVKLRTFMKSDYSILKNI